MGTRFEFSTFTSAEAARVSGVNGTQQRNLRRHGYLPEQGKGWTRYSIQDVARLIVVGKLSELGVTPAVSTKVADKKWRRTAQSAATIICAFAANDRDAILEDVPNKFDEDPIKTGPLGLPRFLVIRPGRECDFARQAPTFTEDGEGALTVMDLQGLARLLVKRAEKPLVTVKADT